MLDEVLLDDPQALARADEHGLLRGLASAGARVRTAARLAAESGLTELKPEGRPRVILVAGSGQTAYAGELLAALAHSVCPIVPISPTSNTTTDDPQWSLPGWANPLDLLLLASPTGAEPGLISLVEQVYQRGCAITVVAPPDSALAGAARQARGFALAYAPPGSGFGAAGGGRGPSGMAPGSGHQGGAPGGFPGEHPEEDTGELWALLIPLLALADRIGVAAAPSSAISAAADHLDEQAAVCGPASATYHNPAKTLTTELSDVLPLLWSQGPRSDAVANRFAACLASRAGRPALPSALPEAMAAHRGLLTGSFGSGDDPDDFFRDRVDEVPTLRLRVVLLRDHAHQVAGKAATAAHRLARAHNTAVSEINASAVGSLEATAQLLAITDFSASYLALAEQS